MACSMHDFEVSVKANKLCCMKCGRFVTHGSPLILEPDEDKDTLPLNEALESLRGTCQHTERLIFALGADLANLKELGTFPLTRAAVLDVSFATGLTKEGLEWLLESNLSIICLIGVKKLPEYVRELAGSPKMVDKFLDKVIFSKPGEEKRIQDQLVRLKVDAEKIKRSIALQAAYAQFFDKVFQAKTEAIKQPEQETDDEDYDF